MITNRHCVTGKDKYNYPFKESSFEPTHLQVHFHERGEELTENSTAYRWKPIEVNLYKNGDPDWIEHPKGRLVDIAAMRLDSPSAISVDCVNDRRPIAGWSPEVGGDCFIVGYPEGLAGSDATPIWKRASIASEPELDYKAEPIFLCDSATRPGLSGGPVFGRFSGMFNQNFRRVDPYSRDLELFGYWVEFLGVYAGREGESRDGFQLARVWKGHLIAEILEANRLADSPFIIHAKPSE